MSSRGTQVSSLLLKVPEDGLCRGLRGSSPILPIRVTPHVTEADTAERADLGQGDEAPCAEQQVRILAVVSRIT